MAGPTSFEELRDALQQRLATFAPGQLRIARVLLSDPEGCAFRTIGELAKVAEVHESSIVRFADKLGLDGYPALVRLCRQYLADQAHIVRRFDNMQAQSEADDLLGRTARHDQDSLTRTFARLDRNAWDDAVEALAGAPRVHAIGLRNCYAVAYHLAYLLHLVRPEVRLITVEAGLLVDQLRDLASDELLVAVSIHPYTADTVKAMSHASARGLRTIALTDSPESPLVPDADTVLYVESSGVTLLRSLTAFTCVVQALATATALRLGPRSRSRLILDDQLFQEFGIYTRGSGHPLPEMSLVEKPAGKRTGRRGTGRR
jgi:DNA-binding MurR/RpiR family transcriptional regulator